MSRDESSDEKQRLINEEYKINLERTADAYSDSDKDEDKDRPERV